MLELYSRNNLDKYISGILLRMNLFKLDVTLIKNLPNKVKSDIDVLRSCTIDMVTDNAHAITVDLQ